MTDLNRTSIRYDNRASVIFAVIPAYNEAATIRDICIRALRHVEHLVVVDDGSTDGTAAALQDLSLRVLRNPTNLGKSASLRRGMLHALNAGATGIITLDADGQHEPEDIPRLLAAHHEQPEALVIGARLRDRQHAPWARAAANRVADFWIGWAGGFALSDSQSGFRLYPASVLVLLDLMRDQTQAFVFESAVLIDASRRGVKCVSVLISAIYRPDARASHFRPVTDVLLITRMIVWKILTRELDLRGLRRSRQCPERAPQSDLAA